ncbi:MAG: hypothetical protein LBL99_00070 [Holosporaceae bacterium]|jgi:hypothetical protein|nr:hypothetical protein [Holosporaceae bacterium]
MKAEFKNITPSHINAGSVFYLYGNYKKTFEAFCEYVQDELRKKSYEVTRYFCSVSESLKIINGQCDLFATGLDCFHIRNVEDSHLESVEKFFNEKNRVFILESGNYLKCKKITDYFINAGNATAIASFNNELTLRSFAAMFFPNAPRAVREEIVKILLDSDEEPLSVFKKIALLLDGDALDDLKNYSAHKRSFLNGLDIIPLIRLLLQTAVKNRIAKPSNFLKIDVSNKNTIRNLIKAELNQKFGRELSKGYVYGGINQEFG